MFEVLDDISELAYVIDPETYEILYINETGRKSFHLDDTTGLKCYEAFQGLDAPCEFCTTNFLRKGETYTWERYNPVTDRYYLLKDRLIDWAGKTVRLEVAFDCTEQADEKRELKNALNAEIMLMHCVRRLHNEKDILTGVNNMLRQVGREFMADRAYIFEVSGDRMSNTYEWCAPGVEPQIDSLQDMDAALMARWRICFDRDECVIIEDIKNIKESSPDEYEALAVQGVKSLAAVPLERDGELWGFFGTDNPSPERLHNIEPLLSTLRYFLMATMLRLEGQQKLEIMSFHDALTGLYNRNRYVEDMERLKEFHGQIGVVYMDLNGLKDLNDRRGHAEGDAALLWCAQTLKKAFPEADCYRVGGDEFIALQKNVAREEFERNTETLHKSAGEGAPYRIAVGARWDGQVQDTERMIQDADEEMYEQKRSFYRREGIGRNMAKSAKLMADDPIFKEYNMLMSAMHVSVSKHLVREDFRVVWANDSYYKLTGYEKEEYEQRFHNRCLEYFANDMEEYQKLQKIVIEAFKAGKPSFESTIRMPRKDGTHIWIRVVGTFTDEVIDKTPVVYAIFTDVTDIVQMRIEQSATYDNIPGFVTKLRISKDGPHFLYGNKQFMEFHGEQTPGRPGELLLANLRENQEVIDAHYGKLRAGEPANFEIRSKNVKGQLVNFQLFGDCVERIQGDPVYLFVFIDVTEQARQRERLRELAFVDPVTGGLNRTCFEIEAGGAVAAAPAGTYMIVSLDIQKFKVINDLFGIGSGDRTLQYVYEKIRANLGEDEYVSRLASDDFCLLIKGNKKEMVKARIAALVEDINSFNKDLGRKYFLTFVAGIYPVDDPFLMMTQMQDRANVARKQVGDITDGKLFAHQFYSNKDRVDMAREKEIENRMRDALENGEFEVYLQPKQDIRSQTVAGAEALVRWNDPAEGLLPPGEFIPLFEKNGFVVDLDLYVFDRVCAVLQKWIDRGLAPLPISVNMSRAHLANPLFLERYEEIRARYDIPCNLIEIEITETLVFGNPQHLAQVIDDIHRCNYLCSMDDFGSGYSSLNMLKNIRVDTLKLDRAFFASERIEDPWEAAVIELIVELAKKLGMNTVAEGVETEEQAAFLKKAGCDMIQGYLFSRPVPIEQFETFAFGKAVE